MNCKLVLKQVSRNHVSHRGQSLRSLRPEVLKYVADYVARAFPSRLQLDMLCGQVLATEDLLLIHLDRLFDVWIMLTSDENLLENLIGLI